MTLKLKTLGLMLAAVLAVSALGASAASAAEFHSSAVPNTLSGAQSTSHVFTTTSGTITCKTVTLSGVANSTTTTTITMTPNYDNCTAFGFIGVPVHENGCDFTFAASGTTNVVCPAGKEIEATVPGCTTTFGSQHIPTGKVFTSTLADIISHTNIKGIRYRECGGTLQEGATYTGTTTVVGPSNITYT